MHKQYCIHILNELALLHSKIKNIVINYSPLMAFICMTISYAEHKRR